MIDTPDWKQSGVFAVFRCFGTACDKRRHACRIFPEIVWKNDRDYESRRLMRLRQQTNPYGRVIPDCAGDEPRSDIGVTFFRCVGKIIDSGNSYDTGIGWKYPGCRRWSDNSARCIPVFRPQEGFRGND